MLATVVYQPVPDPGSYAAYAELARRGVIVDDAGIPVRTGTCSWCGVLSILNLTCPRSLPCPTCRATSGSPCRRPSEHVLSKGFDGEHVPRRRAAYRLDEARHAAGDRSALLAPWPVDTPAVPTGQQAFLF